jgi:cellulose synthase/poly-beta-1,6-N-acetylglucosamine synthase-like glycosyltransferase
VFTALQTLVNLAVILGIVIGFSFSLWAVIGLLRFFTDWTGLVPNEPRSARRHPSRMWKPGEPLHLAGRSERNPEHRVTLSDVAVIIPARNEEGALPRCVASLSRVIPVHQVYVANDGSTDRTVEIARSLGCQVSDIRPNGGKAKALQRVINEHALCRNYKAVLILDADSEADENYFRYALPLFDDPNVVTIAGHQLSTWRPDWFPSLRSVLQIVSFRASRQDAVNVVSGLRSCSSRLTACGCFAPCSPFINMDSPGAR